MIPVSVSDILKILDKIPIWKTLAEMPKRVEELERRVAALEAQPKEAAADPSEQCPKCRAYMTLLGEERAKALGNLGMKTRRFRCESCGVRFDRNWHPTKGYC